MALPSEKLAQSLAVLRQVQQTEKHPHDTWWFKKPVPSSKDYRRWYQEMFAPSVMAGIIKISDIAGYRSNQVYIRNSKHTPLSPEAVRDAMPVLLICLKMSQTLGPVPFWDTSFSRSYTHIWTEKRTNGAFPYEYYCSPPVATAGQSSPKTS